MAEKSFCFYYVNTTDIQEYTGLILECVRANIHAHIMVFDITSEKRNFYYYSLHDFEDYFDRVFSLNGLEKKYSIHKYTKNDETKYLSDYQKINPNLVFTRIVKNLKYAYWTPVVEKNKSVVFLWEPQQTHPKYDNFLTLSRYVNGVIGFMNNNTADYSGLLRYVGAGHTPCLGDDIVEFCKKEKTCFIPETWARNPQDKKNNLPFVLEVVQSLKSMGYSIAYKMREKGYPAQDRYDKNYVNEVESLVDLVITKDLHYPSSLYYLIENCDLTCTFNVTTTTLDAIDLSKNSFVFLSKHLNNHYRSKLKEKHPLSWGIPYFYDNLKNTTNLYDQKYETQSVKSFLVDNEFRERAQTSFVLNDNPHRDLIQRLLHI